MEKKEFQRYEQTIACLGIYGSLGGSGKNRKTKTKKNGFKELKSRICRFCEYMYSIEMGTIIN
jgi:hypothetical protein